MSLVRYTPATPALRPRTMRRGPVKGRLAPSMRTRASLRAILWCALTGGSKGAPTVPSKALTLDRTVPMRAGRGVVERLDR